MLDCGFAMKQQQSIWTRDLDPNGTIRKWVLIVKLALIITIVVVVAYNNFKKVHP